MGVTVHYFTDPACTWSWASEPKLRRLMVEFGDELSFTWVMGGLAREYSPPYDELLLEWLDVADEGGMPSDARLWRDGPIGSTYPACIAVKAAAEQGPEAAYRYLRAVREGLFCFRRKLDATEALVEEARRAGLDVERFRIDLASHATLEAFGADLERTRDVPDEAPDDKVVETEDGRRRVSFPSAAFEGEDGGRHWVFGVADYDAYRGAAEAAGAQPAGGSAPGVTDAIRRFGRMAQAEVESVCDLPGPRAAAELWDLVANWKLRPVRVLTGHLFEPA